jgi:hypothetical protein
VEICERSFRGLIVVHAYSLVRDRRPAHLKPESKQRDEDRNKKLMRILGSHAPTIGSRLANVAPRDAPSAAETFERFQRDKIHVRAQCGCWRGWEFLVGQITMA